MSWYPRPAALAKLPFAAEPSLCVIVIVSLAALLSWLACASLPLSCCVTVIVLVAPPWVRPKVLTDGHKSRWRPLVRGVAGCSPDFSVVLDGRVILGWIGEQARTRFPAAMTGRRGRRALSDRRIKTVPKNRRKRVDVGKAGAFD